MHERKIMLTFFCRLRPHAFFEYHAYFETSVLSQFAYEEENGDTGAVRDWASVSVYHRAALGQPWAFFCTSLV